MIVGLCVFTYAFGNTNAEPWLPLDDDIKYMDSDVASEPTLEGKPVPMALKTKYRSRRLRNEHRSYGNVSPIHQPIKQKSHRR